MQTDSQSVFSNNPSQKDNFIPLNRYGIFGLQYIMRACYYMSRQIHNPYLDDLRKDLSISEKQIGQISLYMYSPYLTLAFLGGYLCDRFERKYLIIAGWSCDVLGLLICAASLNILAFKSYAVFVTGRAFTILGQTFAGVCMSTYIGDLFQGNKLTQMMAYYTTALALGHILSNMVPVLIDSFMNFKQMWFLMACISSANLLTFIIFNPKIPRGWVVMYEERKNADEKNKIERAALILPHSGLTTISEDANQTSTAAVNLNFTPETTCSNKKPKRKKQTSIAELFTSSHPIIASSIHNLTPLKRQESSLVKESTNTSISRNESSLQDEVEQVKELSRTYTEDLKYLFKKKSFMSIILGVAFCTSFTEVFTVYGQQYIRNIYVNGNAAEPCPVDIFMYNERNHSLPEPGSLKGEGGSKLFNYTGPTYTGLVYNNCFNKKITAYTAIFCGLFSILGNILGPFLSIKLGPYLDNILSIYSKKDVPKKYFWGASVAGFSNVMCFIFTFTVLGMVDWPGVMAVHNEFIIWGAVSIVFTFASLRLSLDQDFTYRLISPNIRGTAIAASFWINKVFTTVGPFLAGSILEFIKTSKSENAFISFEPSEKLEEYAQWCPIDQLDEHACLEDQDKMPEKLQNMTNTEVFQYVRYSSFVTLFCVMAMPLFIGAGLYFVGQYYWGDDVEDISSSIDGSDED